MRINISKKVIEKTAARENVSVPVLEELIDAGSTVVPVNKKRYHIEKPCAIGGGLSIKVNANIGASPDICDMKKETAKLQEAVNSGADTVMDLTVGPRWKEMLENVLENSLVPVGTVPIYAAVSRSCDIAGLAPEDFIDAVRVQAEMGVDFMTVHSGVTRKVAEAADKQGRTCGIVSRGGKLIYRWMKKNGMENPLYDRFDEILEIAARYGVTLSLGDGLRPGAISDASDIPQYSELEVLGRLASRCREANVQVMIEGPGHVPLHLIKENIEKQKELCSGAPFYILGPLVTDIAAGYDHIAGAIGGALAGWAGADFLCYLTPAEHLHLPSLEDVREGVMASRIAAHSADIARGLPGASERDLQMSLARKKLDWDKMQELSLDPEKVGNARKKYRNREDSACTMCGDFCAMIDDPSPSGKDD